jgi:hypothetical protein
MQNITELRDSLIDNFVKVKTKKMKVRTAKELANQATKIIYSLKIEMQYNKQTNNPDRKINFMESEKPKITLDEAPTLLGIEKDFKLINTLKSIGFKYIDDVCNSYKQGYKFDKVRGIGTVRYRKLYDLILAFDDARCKTI